MKPKEFWDCTYKEVTVYCQANVCKITDDFRRQIQIQEAVSNKMIKSNPMMYKNPEVISLFSMFKEIFNQKEEEQTIEEQIAILRSIK